MVADIFYPILTLKITVLACFIQKKNLGASPPARASPLTPWWVYSSPIPSAANKKQKKNDASIFFLDYPLMIYHNVNRKNEQIINFMQCTKCKLKYIGKAEFEFNIQKTKH